MNGYVVDASVAVKWMVEEEFSRESASLLDARLTLQAPELLFAEVANALWAMHRRGDIDGNALTDAIDLLRAAPIVTPLPMRQLAAAATRLATDLRHPVYDCFYLALAVHEQHPVVTADTRFYDTVRRHPYLSDRVVHVANLTNA